MRFTTFPDSAAASLAGYDETLTAFFAGIANPPTYESKAHCPWIKLAVFGDVRTESGCLRHNANMLAITGLEGDYDGESVTLEEAADMARAAGLRCVLYTSASHRPDAPRWRVLAPLSREYPPDSRDALMDRLNGVFGGVLTGESWNRSQAFLWGRVAGAEYQCIIV